MMFTLSNEFYLKKAAGREHQRLFNKLLTPTTKSFLKTLPIKKGDKILDMGCSTGQVSNLLQKKVGVNGLIVGVDKSKINVEIAKEKMMDRTPLDVSFYHFLDNDWKIKNHYDIVYGRLFFNQLKHPKEVLERIYKYLKPGGILIVEDMDFSNCYCYPHCYAFNRYFELFVELKKRNLEDATIGSKLFAYIKSKGFQNVKAQVVSPSFVKSKHTPITSLSLESMSETLLKEKLITQTELQALLFEIKDFECRSDALISLPSIYQVWGYRPLE